MDPALGQVALIALGVAIAIVGDELRHAKDPVYRKGCNECDAAARRVEQERRETVHDMQHRGVKAPGMPAPTVDRWDCDDPSCPRNRPRR